MAQAVLFFLAGYETTATTLSFMAHCLAVNQDIQDRLRKQIQQVMGTSAKPDYDRIAEMPYLDMCVNETLRLYPPASRAERICNEDWECRGLKVEKGTSVIIPIFAMHRDPEFWPEPEVYDPERYIAFQHVRESLHSAAKIYHSLASQGYAFHVSINKC